MLLPFNQGFLSSPPNQWFLITHSSYQISFNSCNAKTLPYHCHFKDLQIYIIKQGLLFYVCYCGQSFKPKNQLYSIMILLSNLLLHACHHHHKSLSLDGRCWLALPVILLSGTPSIFIFYIWVLPLCVVHFASIIWGSKNYFNFQLPAAYYCRIFWPKLCNCQQCPSLKKKKKKS